MVTGRRCWMVTSGRRCLATRRRCWTFKKERTGDWPYTDCIQTGFSTQGQDTSRLNISIRGMMYTMTSLSFTMMRVLEILLVWPKVTENTEHLTYTDKRSSLLWIRSLMETLVHSDFCKWFKSGNIFNITFKWIYNDLNFQPYKQMQIQEWTII